MVQIIPIQDMHLAPWVKASEHPSELEYVAVCYWRLVIANRVVAVADDLELSLGLENGTLAIDKPGYLYAYTWNQIMSMLKIDSGS